MEQPIRVILLDDHRLVMEGLHNRLKLYSDMEVIAAFTDPLELLHCIPQLQGDVIVMDVSLPHMTGFELVSRLRKVEGFSMKIVMLSGYMYDVLVQKACLIGASAYLSKQAPYEQIIHTIRQTALGHNLLTLDPCQAVKQEQLTAIECKVLQRIAEEKNNKQVAYDLAISLRTLEAHIMSIHKKLGVKSRNHAVAKGYELGLIQPVSTVSPASNP